ncbi:lactose permease [Pseudomassariella vexata]|uniref:Lactose permease n=1 Tax=Pseudomassariella vexata TaxID=1141098 RepID=A0A1Y2DT95_9PEZI|nr:lactose permease [Pseudomassariella vexata]ORY62389.1 lactose permease [Pseudomassariella vexata]
MVVQNADEKMPQGLLTEHHYPVVAEGSGVTASKEGARAKKVHNAELFAAVQETRIKKWSKTSIQLYFSIFIAFCCACANGYDGSLMTAIIAMPHFQNTFHTGTTGTQVSLIFSLYTVGSMVGAPFAAILSDRLGRKKGMFIGGLVIIVGMILVSTASTVPQFVVGRFVLGCGISVMTVAAPAYSVEIAPPHWRGRCTGFYNCGWFGGSIPAAAITYGTNFIDNNYSWRIPLIGQAFTCIIVMISVFFIPESPRFLIANGREQEAVDFLVKYHGNGDPASRLVLLEIEEMRDNIQQDGIDKTNFDYRPLFLTHNGRWRMGQVLMISIFGQFSGNGLGYFNTVIFNNLGVTSVSQQLAYNLLNSVISAIGALIAVALTDRMLRRMVLVWGTLACIAALATNSGLSAVIRNQGDNIDLSYGKGALASYFLFNVIFSFTYTPLQGVIPTEALETTMRAKGLAASGIIVSAMGFINQFAGPIALQNIQNQYIYVFVGWDCVEALMWYLFGVESQGRTLEQLEWVYSQPNPVKASLKVDKVVIQADGKVTEKIIGVANV